MGLDKAIQSGKERRKAYRGAKAVDCSCRNHGSCEWCRKNRTYRSERQVEAMKQEEREYGILSGR